MWRDANLIRGDSEFEKSENWRFDAQIFCLEESWTMERPTSRLGSRDRELLRESQPIFVQSVPIAQTNLQNVPKSIMFSFAEWKRCFRRPKWQCEIKKWSRIWVLVMVLGRQGEPPRGWRTSDLREYIGSVSTQFVEPDLFAVFVILGLGKWSSCEIKRGKKPSWIQFSGDPFGGQVRLSIFENIVSCKMIRRIFGIVWADWSPESCYAHILF